MKRRHDQRGAVSRLPAPLLRRHRHSRANVLVLGGSAPRRLELARTVHAKGPFAQHSFVAFDCTRDEARLVRSLEDWLLEDGHAPALVPERERAPAVVYLESFSHLSATTQRLLLIVAHRLQGHVSEPGPPGPLRLMAGERADPVRHGGGNPLLRALVDHLDKIRIDVGRISERGAA